MPGDYNNGDMKHRNGAIVQHSKRKSEYRPAGNYHSGSKMSRNQSTGAQGAENAKPGEVTDTSKMSPRDRLEYMNRLGLLNPDQKAQLAAMDAPKEQPKSEPQQKPEEPNAPNANPVNELVQKLQQTFGSKPELLQSIVQSFKAVPKDDLKDKAHSVLNIVKSSQGQSSAELYTEIMQELEGSHEVPHTPDVSSEDDDIQFDDREEELGKAEEQSQYSLEQVRDIYKRVLDKNLGLSDYNSFRDFINAGNNRSFQEYLEQMSKNPNSKPLYDYAMQKLNDFDPEEGEDSKFINIGDAVFSIIKDGLDAQGSSGEHDSTDMDSDDDYEQEEEKGRDLDRQWGSMSERDFRKDYAFLGNRFLDSIIKQAKQFKHYESALSAIANGIHNVDNNNDDEIMRSMESTADDLSAMGFDVKDSADENNSTEPSEKPKLNQSEQHSYRQDKEAYEEPTLEQGLQKFRTPDERQMKDVDKFLGWLANKMKESGTDPKSINRTISHYRDIAKNNIYKFNKGRNAIADNAEAYDPEYGSEVEHYLNSMESTMEDYDRGEITPWEKQFEQLYNKLHGKK